MVNDIDHPDMEQESNQFTIEAGERAHDDDLMDLVRLLLKKYETVDLKRPNLYISFKVRGYEVIKNIPVFKSGFFCYKLKPVQVTANCMKIRLQPLMENIKSYVVEYAETPIEAAFEKLEEQVVRLTVKS